MSAIIIETFLSISSYLHYGWAKVPQVKTKGWMLNKVLEHLKGLKKSCSNHIGQALTNWILSDIHSWICVLHYLFVNILLHIKVFACPYLLSKKYLTCIPREHKRFWQLSWLASWTFAINAIASLSVHEKLNIPEVYSPSYKFKMELLGKMVNS